MALSVDTFIKSLNCIWSCISFKYFRLCLKIISNFSFDMNSLKRKITEETSESKRKKLELCPHAEKCYRRNPHHFKQYSHPHLEKLLNCESLTIPKEMPLSKEVYEEQIVVLKSLSQQDCGKQNETNTNNSASEKASSSVIDLTASSSSETSTAIKFDSDPRGKDFSKATMVEKLTTVAPYNYLFTSVPKSPDTLKHHNSIRFTDLLCPSLGVLKESLQINFMIDIGWLLEQYKARNVSKLPLTIIYGDEWPDMDTFIDRFCPNVTYQFVKMKDPFGCHHSKIGIYLYEDNSVRVVVSTANLYYEDWNHYNQGLWLSPKCPALPSGSSEKDGESPTGFKNSLIKYLESYKFDCLKKWIGYVKNADFSDIKVFLVTSIPGKHNPNSLGCHLHMVGDLLSKYCELPEKTTPQSEGPLSWGVIAQASSIGSMGKAPADWLRGCLLRSLASHKKGRLPANSNASLSIVYPSVDNVMNGYFGPESGGCLPYSKATNEKQKWLQSYMHQWVSDNLSRTRAMPHHKSYTRVSPCLSKLAFFLLTSANLSKSAWGGNIQRDKTSYVRSYECGVMFLPKFFGEEYFEIARTAESKNKVLFPFIYDLPLTSYKASDYPWCN